MLYPKEYYLELIDDLHMFGSGALGGKAAAAIRDLLKEIDKLRTSSSNMCGDSFVCNGDCTSCFYAEGDL